MTFVREIFPIVLLHDLNTNARSVCNAFGCPSQVSWIRRRDSHILTIDWLLFIADDRFRIFLVEPTCTWTLQIKYVQPRDAGVYECQINTSPKMSHLVQLNVVGKYAGDRYLLHPLLSLQFKFFCFSQTRQPRFLHLFLILLFIRVFFYNIFCRFSTNTNYTI